MFPKNIVKYQFSGKKIIKHYFFKIKNVKQFSKL